MKATPRWEEEVFLFWLFLPKRERGFAAARSGQGRAVFWRGGAEPLTARTAATESTREEKTTGEFISIPWRTTLNHDQ